MQNSGKTSAYPERRVVALLIETSNRYSRELLHGIHAWARDHGDWSLHLTEQGRGDGPPSWLRHWRGDGIIARLETPAAERAVRAVGTPVVNVSATGLAPEFPSVVSDSAQVTRLAAEHLLERGFRRFAFCGEARFAWSAKHQQNFAACLKKLGHDCAVFPSHPRDFKDWEVEQRKLARWLKSLPKPVGIMACYDIRGQQVLDVCRALGLSVPEEVGVIGQHNDDLLCDLCNPPLTSVIPNARLAGREAAQLLDRLMRGEKIPARAFNIPPLGVAVRQSTNIVALGDPRVAAAARFIEENPARNVSVDEMARLAGMSRTLLERQFRALLGCAPHEFLLRARLRRARELLAGGELTIAEVAERAGFSSPEYFSAVVRRHLHASPRQLRLKLRRESLAGASPAPQGGAG